MRTWIRKAERATLRAFGKAERTVAWVLCIGAIVTFVSVFTGLIAAGELRLVTLLVAAGLAFDGYSALRDAYDSEEETG
jgi:hypothetical protein